MTGIDIQDQAERFLSWFSRLRGTPIASVFVTWARSKSFSLEDTSSIWRAVEQEIAGHLDPEESLDLRRPLDLAEIASGSEGKQTDG